MHVWFLFFLPTRIHWANHFHNNLCDEDYTKLGDIRYVYIFSSISLFILLLACINFINLSTAVSERNTKDTGIRKILGAKKAVLVKASILKSLSPSASQKQKIPSLAAGSSQDKLQQM